MELAASDQLPTSSDERGDNLKLADRMKLYVEKIILMCTTMLSVLQQSVGYAIYIRSSNQSVIYYIDFIREIQ